MMSPKKKALLDTLYLAFIVHDITIKNGENLWFTKLKNLVGDELTLSEINVAFDFGLDWGVIELCSGETEDGRCGFLIELTQFTKLMMEKNTTIDDCVKHWEYIYGSM